MCLNKYSAINKKSPKQETQMFAKINTFNNDIKEELNSESNDKMMSSNKEIPKNYEKKGSIKIEESKVIVQEIIQK